MKNDLGRRCFDLAPGRIGPVTVGAPRAAVHAALGEPTGVSGETERWLENALRIDFDSRDNVEFVEVHRGAPFDVRVGDVDPFACAGDQLEDLLVPVFGPFVVAEHGETWVFPGSQLAVYRPAWPQTLSVASPGYHDNVVRGDVRSCTVLALDVSADGDEAAEDAALLLVRDALEGRADAVRMEFDVLAAFLASGQAIAALAAVRALLGPDIRVQAALDVGPTFVGTMTHEVDGRVFDGPEIAGPTVDLARRMRSLHAAETLVSEAARGEVTDVGPRIEFPVRKPQRARAGEAPPAPGPTAVAFPVL